MIKCSSNYFKSDSVMSNVISYTSSYSATSSFRLLLSAMFSDLSINSIYHYKPRFFPFSFIPIGGSRDSSQEGKCRNFVYSFLFSVDKHGWSVKVIMSPYIAYFSHYYRTIRFSFMLNQAQFFKSYRVLIGKSPN